MRKILLSFMLAAGLTVFIVGPAIAGHSSDWGDRTIWNRYPESSKGCTFCHANQKEHTAGPHGGYQTTTDKCMACHTVHKAENEALLPGTTVTGTCNFCHDLTQTEYAPYFTAYLSSGEGVKSAHQVEGLDHIPADGIGDWDGSLSIPGGDPVSGDAKNLDASAQGRLSTETKFTCDSCHTPHAIEGSTVEPYFGESHLKFEINSDGNAGRFWVTDRLLKAKLNGASGFKYNKYDSDWCAACHQGRFKNGVIHNHPVAMSGRLDAGVVAADPADAEGYQFLRFLTAADYDNGASKTWLINNAKNSNGEYNTFYWAKDGAAALKSGNIVDLGVRGSGPRVLKKDPRTNKAFSMTEGDPVNKNTPRADGYVSILDYPDGPACQQCHGNARDVEKPFLESLEDGNNGYMVMTFPHVSKNKALTVENHDDFCTNCHGLENLP